MPVVVLPAPKEASIMSVAVLPAPKDVSCL